MLSTVTVRRVLLILAVAVGLVAVALSVRSCGTEATDEPVAQESVAEHPDETGRVERRRVREPRAGSSPAPAAPNTAPAAAASPSTPEAREAQYRLTYRTSRSSNRRASRQLRA